MLHQYGENQRRTAKSITELVYYMKGAVTREEAWRMTYRERKDHFKFIDERHKIAQKLNKR